MNDENKTVVTRKDIIRALAEVGVRKGDMLLIHSSLKRFGWVDGGPEAVIDAAKKAVGKTGTLVFPTLVQRHFDQAFINWNKQTSPSDVGLITETFRRLPDSLRSDQATHSVAAWGRLAVELTAEHSAYGPRMGPFGDYSFAYSSPWQKMALHGARIVLAGVDTDSNTFMHFVEYCLMEHFLQQITDPARKCQAMSEISRHNKAGIWPFHDSSKTRNEMLRRGMISKSQCGDSVFTSFLADQYVDTFFQLFRDNPERWLKQDVVRWINEYVY